MVIRFDISQIFLIVADALQRLLWIDCLWFFIYHLSVYGWLNSGCRLLALQHFFNVFLNYNLLYVHLREDNLIVGLRAKRLLGSLSSSGVSVVKLHYQKGDTFRKCGISTGGMVGCWKYIFIIISNSPHPYFLISNGTLSTAECEYKCTFYWIFKTRVQNKINLPDQVSQIFVVDSTHVAYPFMSIRWIILSFLAHRKGNWAVHDREHDLCLVLHLMIIY